MVQPADGNKCHQKDRYSQFPREGGMECHARPHREAPGLVRRQREQGENILRAFMVISVGRNGWGRGSSLESAGLNNFSVLCGVRTVPGSLVPSFEVMRAGRWWPRVLAPFKGGGWGMGSGVVGLVMKGMLSEGELLNTSGNLPVLWEVGKAVLPGSAGLQKYMVNTRSFERNKSL